MKQPAISLESRLSAEGRQKVIGGLMVHNREQTGDGSYEDLTFLLRDSDGEVVGGLLGEIYWGWLHIDVLWVHERFRNGGMGRELMQAAEQEAVRQGCTAAFLDTFSFQALPFYLGLGYEIFGELNDFPPGHGRYFLKKALTERS